jgi:hypothetical protein
LAPGIRLNLFLLLPRNGVCPQDGQFESLSYLQKVTRHLLAAAATIHCTDHRTAASGEDGFKNVILAYKGGLQKSLLFIKSM